MARVDASLPLEKPCFRISNYLTSSFFVPSLTELQKETLLVSRTDRDIGCLASADTEIIIALLHHNHSKLREYLNI